MMARFSVKSTFATLALFCLFAAPAWARPEVECTLIQDAATGAVLLRKGACDQRFSPFSTFKLPLALIGFDAGILRDPQTPAWDYRPEYAAVAKDRKRVDPTIWLKDSVLWYSREITRRLGTEDFATYIARLNYGNRDVSGDPGQNNGLTHAWLRSSLVISPDEQVAFLRRIDAKALGLSDKAYEMTIASLPTFESAGGWKVRGKTGSGWHRDKAGKPDPTRPQGWFVGWAERGGRTLVFARFERGQEKRDSYMGLKVRDDFLKALPTLVK